MPPDKKKNKNKKKLTTKENFKRPKNPSKYGSPTVFNNFVSQFIDKIDTGRHKGKRKSHSLINKYLSQKNGRSTHNITLRVKKPSIKTYVSKAPHVPYINSIEEHLNGDYYVYYQNKSDSYIHLIDFDFDSIDAPDDNLMDDIVSVIKLQRCFFNGSYFDMGSSSHSLNQFILVDSEPLFDLYLFSCNHSIPFQRYTCHIYSHISRLLRFAYNNRSPVQLPHNLKFDGIKGTVANYDYSYINGNVYYNKIINSGVFAKLPRPSSDQQFHDFYHMPIVDIFDVINFSLYLFNISVSHFSPKTKKEQSYLNRAVKSYNTLFELTQDACSLVGDDFLHCHSENTPHLVISPYIPLSSYTLVTLTGNPDLNTKNEDLEIAEKTEISDEYAQNANTRRWAILTRLTREYYLEHGQQPTKEWRERKYREHPASTGQADDEDIEEIYEICELIDKDFDPNKLGDDQRIIITQEYIDNDEKRLMNILTMEQINNIKISHGISYGKIHVSYRDLAIGHSYFVEKSLKGKVRKEQEKRELTVATKPMADYTQKLYKRGILKRKETWKDEKKCRAIRYILEQIGWLKCLDGNWDVGVAKRWAIGKHHHRHNEFIGYVGKPTVDRIRAKGMASLEDWDSMWESA